MSQKIRYNQFDHDIGFRMGYSPNSTEKEIETKMADIEECLDDYRAHGFKVSVSVFSPGKNFWIVFDQPFDTISLMQTY